MIFYFIAIGREFLCVFILHDVDGENLDYNFEKSLFGKGKYVENGNNSSQVALDDTKNVYVNALKF